MIKSRAADGMAQVTFTLDRAVGARHVCLCGDFNGWSGDGHRMVQGPDGSFSLTLELEAGRAYRFRYFLDDERWENDWAVDAYVPNDFGGDDSVVDLTALTEDVTSAGPSSRETAIKSGPTRAAAANKTSPGPAKGAIAKKTSAAKTAPKKTAGPTKAATKKAVKKKS